MLGKYEDTWHAMDRAIVLERWKIPLLVRATPVMPVVPANFMLALTSIDDFTYVWNDQMSEWAPIRDQGILTPGGVAAMHGVHAQI